MKNVSKFIQAIVIGVTIFGFMGNACGMGSITEKELVAKIKQVILKGKNLEHVHLLKKKIEEANSEEEVCESIIRAQDGAIDSDTIRIILERIPALSTELYKVLGDSDMLDSVAYETIIDYAGKNRKFNIAYQAFGSALKRNMVTMKTRNIYMIAAAKSGHFISRAKKMYDFIVKAKVDNLETHRSYIDAAVIANDFVEVDRVINALIDNDKMDYYIYDCYMDMVEVNDLRLGLARKTLIKLANKRMLTAWMCKKYCEIVSFINGYSDKDTEDTGIRFYVHDDDTIDRERILQKLNIFALEEEFLNDSMYLPLSPDRNE